MPGEGFTAEESMEKERAGSVSEGMRLVEMRVGSDGVVRVVVAS